MSEVTARERMLAAMRNRQPDRIPVAPDISNNVKFLVSESHVDSIPIAIPISISILRPNGGFILCTGDQCGRDTPEVNLREMVSVAREFGVYPLDFARIDRAIRAL